MRNGPARSRQEYGIATDTNHSRARDSRRIAGTADGPCIRPTVRSLLRKRSTAVGGVCSFCAAVLRSARRGSFRAGCVLQSLYYYLARHVGFRETETIGAGLEARAPTSSTMGASSSRCAGPQGHALLLPGDDSAPAWRPGSRLPPHAQSRRRGHPHLRTTNPRHPCLRTRQPQLQPSQSSIPAVGLRTSHLPH